MALPKLNTPVHVLELPSTGEEIKFRPFLVKEQKLLMLAQESEDDKQIFEAMTTIIKSCTFDKVDTNTSPLFDIEYIFLKLRAKSVGEKAKLRLLCPDDEKTYVNKEIDLDKIEIQMTEGHTNIANITDKIKMIMKYPTLNDMTDISADKTNASDIFEMIKKCVHEIRDGETIYNRVDMSEKDLEEFIDSLTGEQFEKIGQFFETMPKVQHSVEVTNPKTKKKGEVVIEGIESFFD